MLKRIITLPLSLAAAAGVPFFALNNELKEHLAAAIGISGQSDSAQVASATQGSGDEIPSPFARGFSIQSIGRGEESQGRNPFQLASDNRNTNNNGYGNSSSGNQSRYGNSYSGQYGSGNSNSNSSPSLSYGSRNSSSGSTNGTTAAPSLYGSTQGHLTSGANSARPELPEGWTQVPTLGADLRQVIRFDVTPNWIKANWPRVSVGWTEDGLEGFRVPLVTGTQVHDLTGALTYYFDPEHRVQRIRFVGNTGDASPLVDLCQRYFQMRIEPTRIAGLYVRRYHGKPVNVLRVTHESVLRADQTHLQLNVILEINNPQGSYDLSQATIELLEQDPPIID